jgi:hypothetical protein
MRTALINKNNCREQKLLVLWLFSDTIQFTVSLSLKVHEEHMTRTTPIPGHIGAPTLAPEQYILRSHVSVSCVTVRCWRGPVTTSPTVTATSQMGAIISPVVATRIVVSLVVAAMIILLIHAATKQQNSLLPAVRYPFLVYKLSQHSHVLKQYNYWLTTNHTGCTNKRNGPSLILGTISVFACSDWGEPNNTSSHTRQATDMHLRLPKWQAVVLISLNMT